MDLWIEFRRKLFDSKKWYSGRVTSNLLDKLSILMLGLVDNPPNVTLYLTHQLRNPLHHNVPTTFDPFFNLLLALFYLDRGHEIRFFVPRLFPPSWLLSDSRLWKLRLRFFYCREGKRRQGHAKEKSWRINWNIYTGIVNCLIIHELWKFVFLCLAIFLT